ncbi:MAG: FAD-dependent pyridine nucleotide-disulfide oxidoreductase [Acidobacteria bacterium OLB17]|nr:MAG: FAD-dependent pyridine nucleotide-disulfide oxidoreductase [Acidobacteria bacterium OLB17]MCZ2391232.1 NAD(P)-dependent oxidoreductase [Acidobacteriota bacterium]
MTLLPDEQIEKNFADIAPAMTPSEAAVEANRCLFCFDAPCMHACPTHIDVPGFIKKIASGNLRGSARVILDANPIGATCARVCPVEVLCEGACVEGTLLQKPIEIGRLQRYATDHIFSSGKQLFEKGDPNGMSIGIVGSGPAGLSCAAYLSRLGYKVTVYERRSKPGGLDTYGMAEYKMSQQVSLTEVGFAANLGVEFKTNVEVGSRPASTGVAEKDASSKDREHPADTIAFDDLAERHDAVFLAVGLGRTNDLNIPGEHLEGVFDALSLIEQIKTRDWKSVPVGRTVVVIGAGNTAVDAATQAKRLGAERVIMAYRRSSAEMPAYEYEFELAKNDGVEFVWHAKPIEIVADEAGSKVRTLRCERADAAGEIFEIPCDMVIKAVGQQKLGSFFSDVAGVETDSRGRVVVNSKMQTSKPSVFAGGDCVNGGGEAVEAAQMGKLAAQGIHEMLSGEQVELTGAVLKAPPKAPVDTVPH